MKVVMALLALIVGTYILPLTAETTKQSNPDIPLPPVHCSAIEDPVEQQQCIDDWYDRYSDPGENLGIACEMFSWTPVGGIISRIVRFVGRTQCPDNGLTQARRQAQQRAVELDCIASAHHRWENGACVRVSCPGGKVVVGQGCQCPAGMQESGRNRTCVPGSPPRIDPPGEEPVEPNLGPPPTPPGLDECAAGYIRIGHQCIEETVEFPNGPID